jgi:acetate kinase
VLTVNAGSSSLKLRVLAGEPPRVEQVLAEPEDLEAAVAWCSEHGVDAVGHRVVHGGTVVRQPTLVDDEVLAALRALVPLAPLHQGVALDAVERLAQELPGVPQVVCADTAFHAGLPTGAATPALPADWRDRYALRRYGFHGLSVGYCWRRVTEVVPGARRVVVAHLGSGASLTAVLDGRSLDTTMGFTPLDGLVMATRSGGLDPGLVLWLVQQGEAAQDVVMTLEKRSGLLALAGTEDMAEVLDRADAGDAAATLALEVYHHRLRALTAQMLAALGGLDVLVLTGGVGERAPRVRRRLGDDLAWAGVALDAAADAAAVGVTDVADVTGAGSRARVLVVAAREDVEIARGVSQVARDVRP